MKMLTLLGCCAVLMVSGWTAQSQETDAASGPLQLEEILITGEYPGPGLWKISKEAGDDEHVLWIFGTLYPIPTSITWKSQQVERIVSESQESSGLTV